MFSLSDGLGPNSPILLNQPKVNCRLPSNLFKRGYLNNKKLRRGRSIYRVGYSLNGYFGKVIRAKFALYLVSSHVTEMQKLNEKGHR